MEKYLPRRSRPLRKFPLARVDRYGSPIPREDKEWIIRDLYRSVFSLRFGERGDRKRTRARKTRPARQLSRAPISLSFSLSFSPDFSYFEHFPTRRGYDPRVGIHMVHGMCAIGRDGVPMIKIEKSASLNVIVNRNTGFHLRVSTNGWNRYFSLWRAWLMTACCKIVSYVGDF